MGNLTSGLTLNNLKKAAPLALIGGALGGGAGALTGAGVGLAGDSLFNNSNAIGNYKPYSFTSPGLSGTVNGTTIDLTQSPEITSALTGIQSTSTNTNAQIQDLINRLGPGYNALTDVALKNLETARLKTVGDLQANLARRRIAGSSFANDALTRANAEFASQGEQIRAQNTLASIDATNKLIQQQHTNAIQSFSATLDQLNLEGATAAQLASGVSGIMSSNAQLQAQLNAQAQAGTGQLFGTIFGPALSGAVSNFLTPASGATAVL